MCAMRLDDFDFVLPGGLIADRPSEPREAARLLHMPAAEAWQTGTSLIFQRCSARAT